MSVLRVIAGMDAVSHLNPSSMSDHSLKDQLGYFINKLEHWDDVDEVALWSAVNDEWMLDITDISMLCVPWSGAAAIVQNFPRALPILLAERRAPVAGRLRGQVLDAGAHKKIHRPCPGKRTNSSECAHIARR